MKIWALAVVVWAPWHQLQPPPVVLLQDADEATCLRELRQVAAQSPRYAGYAYCSWGKPEALAGYTKMEFTGPPLFPVRPESREDENRSGKNTWVLVASLLDTSTLGGPDVWRVRESGGWSQEGCRDAVALMHKMYRYPHLKYATCYDGQHWLAQGRR